MLVGCNKNEPPKQAFEEYINLWNDRKFTNMYDHLSIMQKSISKKNSQKNIKNL